MKSPSVTDLARKRPAEVTAALAGSLGGLATAVLEQEPAAAIVTVIVGLIPALVSQLVDLGPARDGGTLAAGTDVQGSEQQPSAVLERLTTIAALDSLKRSREKPEQSSPLEVLKVLLGVPATEDNSLRDRRQ